MKKQVILFFYTGSHPDKDTIARIAEVLINSGICDPTTLTNINLDEDSMAKTIAEAVAPKASDHVEDDPLRVICKYMAAFIVDAMNDRGRNVYDSMRRKYVESLKCNPNGQFIKCAHAIYNSGRKLDCIRFVKDVEPDLPLIEIKSAIDAIFEIVTLCQGLIVE